MTPCLETYTQEDDDDDDAASLELFSGWWSRFLSDTLYFAVVAAFLVAKKAKGISTFQTEMASLFTRDFTRDIVLLESLSLSFPFCRFSENNTTA